MRPTTARSSIHWLDILSLAIILGFAAVALATFRQFGLGWDDYSQRQYGHYLLDFYSSGFRDRTALGFVNIYLYGGAFDMISALAEKVLPFEPFEIRRLVGGMIGVGGLAIAFSLGRRLAGPLGGFFTMVLLAATPGFFGHMMVNCKDAPFAVALLGIVAALVAAIEAWPRPNWRHAVALGLALGLALGQRVGGAISGSFVMASAALLITHAIRTQGLRGGLSTFGGFVLRLLPALPIGYLVMVSVWPWAGLGALNPLLALEAFAKFPDFPWPELFEGRELLAPDMPRHYVPLMLGMTTPEIVLGAGLAGVAGAVVAAFNGKLPIGRRAALLVLASAAVLPVLIAIAMRPVVYNGSRHFFFVVPPLAVMGGVALAITAQMLQRHVGRVGVAAVLAATLAGVALPAREMLKLHPYEYAYFNDVSGGFQEASDSFMTDYWGLSFKQAAAALKEEMLRRGLFEPPEGGRRWRVATCGPHPAAQIALGPAFEPTYDPKQADFALMLNTFYCAPLPFRPIVTITREDVPLARVYDMRGRSIASVFSDDSALEER